MKLGGHRNKQKGQKAKCIELQLYKEEKLCIPAAEQGAPQKSCPPSVYFQVKHLREGGEFVHQQGTLCVYHLQTVESQSLQ